MFSLRKATFALVAILIFGLLASPSVQAQTYDAARDFSASRNPDSAWRYGYEDILGGSLTLYTSPLKLGASSVGWNAPSSVSYAPLILKNFGTSPDTFADVVLQPGQLCFHPGLLDQNSIVRWTAPKTGRYHVKAAFTPVTIDGTTTDVHVLVNNVSVFNSVELGTYLSPVSAPSYAADLRLKKGDTVDFAVGFGPDGNFFGDSTGLEAAVSRVHGEDDRGEDDN